MVSFIKRMIKRISTLKTGVVSFTRQISKKIHIFVGIILAILIYPIPYASANWNPLSWPGGLLKMASGTLLDGVLFIINGVISIIVGAGIWLSVGLVEWAIAINQTITTVSAGKEEGFAHFGWGITLNFANLLFVIAIVVIAFGTMFRRAWGMKLLPKLIGIALLINFSFFIATELITISNKITNVFLPSDILTSRLGSFATFFTSDTSDGLLGVDWSASVGSTLGSDASRIFSPIFAIVFGFVAILTLISIAVVFFVRYVSLTILLILLPVALGMSLLPIAVGKINAWQEWKNNFLKWLIFGPAVAFFIYLAFSLLDYIPATPTGGFVQTAGGSLGNYLALIGILLGGLMVANKMGIAGAGVLQAGVNFAGGRLQKLAQKRGVIAGNRAEEYRKQGEFGKAKRAEFTASMYKGKYGLTFGTQKLKEGLIKPSGGKAEEMQKLISASQRAKTEGWGDFKIDEKIKKLSKHPENPEYADLLGYAIKESKLKNANDYLTPQIKDSLSRSGKGKLYEDLEKFAVNTSDSATATALGDMYEASRTTARLLEKVKDNEWGKIIKINKIFEDIKAEDHKNADGTYNTVAYNNAVEKNKWERERIVRGLALNQPEKLAKAFGSLAAGEQRINFVKANQEADRGSVDSGFNLSKFDEAIPTRTKEYYVATPAPTGKTKKKSEDMSPAEKLFKGVYEEPGKETLSRENVEAMIKENKI